MTGQTLLAGVGAVDSRRLTTAMREATAGSDVSADLTGDGGGVVRVDLIASHNGNELTIIAQDGYRIDADDPAQVELATLASRLQAVLSSAVELDSSIHDSATIYRATFENLAAAIPFTTGTIQTLHEGMLSVAAHRGFDGNTRVGELVFPLDERFPNSTVVQGRRALALADIRTDYPHFLTEDGQFESGNIRSWLGVPLLDRGEVTGMVTLDRDTVDPFDSEEIEIAQALANHAAVALSNARMYESLQAANRLQEVLLRELHHRVKNNLQLVSSMLNLRTLDLEGPAAQVVADLRTHIQTLAATHDNLFQPGLSEDVVLETYIRDIVEGVHSSYAVGRSISIEIAVPKNLHCPMGVAVPLGLVAGELVLNAVKHAFPTGSGTVTLTVREDDGLVLEVADNGQGLSTGGTGNSGFGFTLVRTLVDQMNGAIESGPLADLSESPGHTGTGNTGTVWRIRVARCRQVPAIDTTA